METHRLDATYRAGWFTFGDRVARLFPRRLLRPIAARLGTLYALTHPRKVAVLQRNLDLLGSPKRHDARRVYEEFSRVMVDYFHAGAPSLDQALALVDERHGLHHLQAVTAAGSGALFLTPHLSFFELGGAVMRSVGYPMVALTNPEPTPELTAWRAAYRLRWGVETIEVGEDEFQFLRIAKELQAGKFVAALFDRPHPTQSYAAQLPGGVLPCSSGVMMLALLAKCPVVPVTVVSKPNGRYRLEALAPIHVERRGSAAETLQYYTQVVVDALLPTLQANPEQWFQFAPLDGKEKETPTPIA